MRRSRLQNAIDLVIDVSLAIVLTSLGGVIVVGCVKMIVLITK